MKKFTYLYIASALILCSACQDEKFSIEDSNRLSFSVSYEPDAQSVPQTKSAVEFTDENGNPAPFNITLSVEDSHVDGPKTKGTPINNMDDFNRIVKEFRAWGYYNGTAWTNVNGSKVKQFAGSDYRPVDGSDNEINAYQPGATDLTKYRFYAIYPYETSELSDRGATVSGNSSAGYTISYTSPGSTDNTNTDDAELQKEVLAGYMESTTSMAKIPVTFKPILAEIRFKVSTKQLGRDVTINSIELKNLYSSGTCTVSNTGIAWATSGTQNTTFKQEYNYDIDHTDTSGPEINDGDLTKTFFIIPQTGSTSTSAGTHIIVNYTDEEGTHEGRHLLYGQQYEPGKTYIYNIGDFKKESGHLEPWVDFSNFTVNDNNLLGKTNKIQEENNSKFIFNFAQQNGVSEKAYFTIYNLVPGNWYSIEFTEKQTLYNKDSNNNSTGVVATQSTFNNVGCYACTICSESQKKTGTNAASQLIVDRFLGQETFIWEHPDDIYNSTNYNSLKDQGETAKITFKATQETMIWEWDFSSGRDNYVLMSEIYLVGEKIKNITPESGVPTIDFLNATMHNFANSDAWNSYSSMKTYAVDATAGSDPVKGTFFFREYTTGNNNYGKINIPIINLNTSKTYRISFKMKKSGTANRTGNNYHLGYLIAETKNTTNNKFTVDASFTDYKETYKSADFTFSDSFTFSPSNENMFWIWDLSAFNSGTANCQFVTFENVTIEEVTP